MVELGFKTRWCDVRVKGLSHSVYGSLPYGLYLSLTMSLAYSTTTLQVKILLLKQYEEKINTFLCSFLCCLKIVWFDIISIRVNNIALLVIFLNYKSSMFFLRCSNWLHSSLWYFRWRLLQLCNRIFHINWYFFDI